MSKTISSSCQNIGSRLSGERGNYPAASNAEEAEKLKKNYSSFAQKFGKRIFEKESKKNQIMKRFAASFANRITTERADVLNKAAAIAKNCGSPSLLNNKQKLLKALVLHMAARIITEQKMAVSKAKEAKDKATKLSRLNTEFTRGFVKKYVDREKEQRSSGSNPRPSQYKRPSVSGGNPRNRSRSRCYSDHGTGSMYDLNQYSYPSPSPSLHSRRQLYTKPLRVISPEPSSYNINVQRRPWSSFAPRAKSASPERSGSIGGGARYRFPAIKKYGQMGHKSKDSNLINLEHN